MAWLGSLAGRSDWILNAVHESAMFVIVVRIVGIHRNERLAVPTGWLLLQYFDGKHDPAQILSIIFSIFIISYGGTIADRHRDTMLNDIKLIMHTNACWCNINSIKYSILLVRPNTLATNGSPATLIDDWCQLSRIALINSQAIDRNFLTTARFCDWRTGCMQWGKWVCEENATKTKIIYQK